MIVVIALGGAALLKRGDPLEANVQRANIARAVQAVAKIAGLHDVVITHGNAQQLALLTAQAEAYAQVPPYPLDMLDAETGGMIGYLVEQELRSCLPKREVVTLLTQVEVSPDDPAFTNPSVMIGPAYSREQAQRLSQARGWKMMAVSDQLWRRVVPSPEPRRILELNVIRQLVKAGAVVVCAGGGGIPVTVGPEGAVRGVEAVIEKDYSAAVLAREIGAAALLYLTDVDAAYEAWGTNFKRPIRETMPDLLRKMSFAPGTMMPKIEAACRFVEAGGFAGIGLLEDADAILEGKRGTIVRKGGVSLDFIPHKPAAKQPGPITLSRAAARQAAKQPGPTTISRGAAKRTTQPAPTPPPTKPPGKAK